MAAAMASATETSSVSPAVMVRRSDLYASFGRLKAELRLGLRTQLGAALVAPRLKALARSLDYAEYGGVPLLGARGPVLVAHGRSNARAIASAVRSAATIAESGLWQALSERFGTRKDG